MPAPFTPTAQIGAADPGLPDGDTPNVPIWRELLNNRRFLRGSLWGAIQWSGQLRVSGTAAAPAVVVGVIDALALCDGAGVWRPYFTLGESAVGAVEIEGGGPLAASTHYYVYAWSDSADPAAVKFQISATPPTPLGATTVRTRYKRGQESNYLYLGSFPTDASGDPIPLRATGGRVYFTAGAFDHATGLGAGTNPLRVLDEGTSTSYADVDLSAVIPPHARLVWLRPKGHDASAADNSFTVRTKGLTFAAFEGTIPASGTVLFGAFPIETDASRLIQYDLGAAGAVSLFVVGFEE